MRHGTRAAMLIMAHRIRRTSSRRAWRGSGRQVERAAKRPMWRKGKTAMAAPAIANQRKVSSSRKRSCHEIRQSLRKGLIASPFVNGYFPSTAAGNVQPR
jgi:hypothetical protein